MPIHPVIAARFALLEGVESMQQLGTDPALSDRLAQWLAWPDATLPPEVEAVDLAAPGPQGAIPLRVYGDLSAPTPSPAMVWFHGGAFVSGDLEMREADWTSREVAHRAGAVVVSVDYRLAQGEVCHPVPLDDCLAATRWVIQHADELGVDTARVFVGGASAGANLATATVLKLRDEESWQPAGLLLIYGTFHPRLPAASSTMARLVGELPSILRFPPETVAGMTTNYVGGPPSSSDGYAMPALADLEGLCPVTLINAEYDALRISAESFAAALAVAGVNVRQVLVPGMLHAFLDLPSDVGPVSDALGLMAEVVSRA